MNKDPVNRPVRRQLNRNERRVMILRALGYTYGQVAYSLAMDFETVRNTLKSAKQKWWFISQYACVAYLDKGELWW